MFLALTIILPLMDNVSLDSSRVIKSLGVWIVVGLAFGLTMQLIENRRE